jgi:hypothetical protein
MIPTVSKLKREACFLLHYTRAYIPCLLASPCPFHLSFPFLMWRSSGLELACACCNNVSDKRHYTVSRTTRLRSAWNKHLNDIVVWLKLTGLFTCFLSTADVISYQIKWKVSDGLYSAMHSGGRENGIFYYPSIWLELVRKISIRSYTLAVIRKVYLSNVSYKCHSFATS